MEWQVSWNSCHTYWEITYWHHSYKKTSPHVRDGHAASAFISISFYNFFSFYYLVIALSSCHEIELRWRETTNKKRKTFATLHVCMSLLWRCDQFPDKSLCHSKQIDVFEKKSLWLIRRTFRKRNLPFFTPTAFQFLLVLFPQSCQVQFEPKTMLKNDVISWSLAKTNLLFIYLNLKKKNL